VCYINNLIYNLAKALNYYKFYYTLKNIFFQQLYVNIFAKTKSGTLTIRACISKVPAGLIESKITPENMSSIKEYTNGELSDSYEGYIKLLPIEKTTDQSGKFLMIRATN